jgi:hypothetical protein
MCGTKGMAVPLVGFAVRLKPSTAAAAFDCEYSGYFQSGVTVGPLRNGAPCRSTVATDPLEGIQIRLVRRAVVRSPAVAAQVKSPPPPLKLKRAVRKAPASPHAHISNGAAKSSGAAKRNSAPRAAATSTKRRVRVHPAHARSTRSPRRPSTRRP